MEPLQSNREREIAYLSGFPDPDSIPRIPGIDGVLLSDQIDYYAKNFKLITPFCEQRLKPAAYELAVGSLYSIRGQTHELTNAPGMKIEIQPFEVAIIQTRERLNMPSFLIARWNIKVSLAYEGLMWVGGPQVDPGWSGFLSCPIYNLSDQPVALRYNDAIAVIDFIPTAQSTNRSIKYKRPKDRTRVTFEEYHPDKLQSALATRADRKLKEFGEEISAVQKRVESYTVSTYGALAILVAAVAVVASKSQTSVDLWNLVAAAIVGAVAFVSLYMFGQFWRRGQGEPLGWGLVVQAAAGLFPILVLCAILDAFFVKIPLEAQVRSLNTAVEKQSHELRTIKSRMATRK